MSSYPFHICKTKLGRDGSAIKYCYRYFMEQIQSLGGSLIKKLRVSILLIRDYFTT